MQLRLVSPVKGVGRDERRDEIRRRGALRPNKLGVGRAGLAVIFNMGLGRFPRVVHCVFMVTAS